MKGAAPDRRRGHRAAALGAVLLAAALGYAVLVLNIGVGEVNPEQRFGDPASDGARQLDVYAELLTVDPVGEATRMRVHLRPSRALQGGRRNTPDRDLTVRLSDGDAVQDLVFRLNEPMSPAAMEADLSGGTVASYPLDRFRAVLDITAHESPPPSDAATPPVPVSVPMSVIMWERVEGWTIRATQDPGSGAGEVRLRLDIRRTGAVVFLALALYGVMALIAGAALLIGSLVFLRERKLEAELAGALSAILFALPAMRFALPGVPPLGVSADFLVFLWSEIAAAIGLLLFVAAWATGGPRE